MGIFDALTTAVAGLQAQSFALQNISGNIANSQTTGYKETDTSFEDLVSAASAGAADRRRRHRQFGRHQHGARDDPEHLESRPTWRSTATAVSWWPSRPASADNQPVFSGVNDYTRAGDFQLNSGGYLVNGAGYYLMGIPIDAATGNPVGSSPQVLQFNNDFMPAQATTAIQYQANLPSTPSFGTDRWDRFRSQSARRRSGRGGDHRHRRDACSRTPWRQSPGQRQSHGRNHAGVARHQLGRHDHDQRRHQYADDLHRTGRAAAPTVNDLITAINMRQHRQYVGRHRGTERRRRSGSHRHERHGLDHGQRQPAAMPPTSDFGAGANSFEPTNLLTQGAVAQGDTMTVTVGNGAPQIITFGTGAGQVATLAAVADRDRQVSPA